VGTYLPRHTYANEVQKRVMPRTCIVVPILLPQHLSRLSTTILTYLEAVEPYLQRHPYDNIWFRFPSSPYYSSILSRLSTTILTFLVAVEPYLQRHTYTNIRFGFPSSPYLLHDFVPSFYHHFNVSWSGGALPPMEPLQQHEIRIHIFALPIIHFFTSFYHHFNVSWSGGA